MKIRILSFFLYLIVGIQLTLASTNNGVIPSASNAGPLSTVDVAPDGGYDFGRPNKGRPGQLFVKTAIDLGGGTKLVNASINLTATQLNAMYATPVVIIPAQGTGKIVIVQKATFKITWTATDFASGGVIGLQYDSTANGAGTLAVDSTLAATFLTHGAAGAAGTAYSVRNGAVLSTVVNTSIENKGLYLSNQTGAFTTGTGAAVVDVVFLVQTVQ